MSPGRAIGGAGSADRRVIELDGSHRDEKKAGRVFADRVRPLCFLGLCLEVGEVTCVPLPLVKLVWEFPFPKLAFFRCG